jgi:hypothetical protein
LFKLLNLVHGDLSGSGRRRRVSVREASRITDMRGTAKMGRKRRTVGPVSGGF